MRPMAPAANQYVAGSWGIRSREVHVRISGLATLTRWRALRPIVAFVLPLRSPGGQRNRHSTARGGERTHHHHRASNNSRPGRQRNAQDRKVAQADACSRWSKSSARWPDRPHAANNALRAASPLGWDEAPGRRQSCVCDRPCRAIISQPYRTGRQPSGARALPRGLCLENGG